MERKGVAKRVYMWIFLALTSSMLWAVVHVLDSDCVDEIFEKPWFGVITSSLASVVAVVLLPFVVWDWPSWHIVILAMLIGVLIQASQAFYFHALAFSEPGIVAAYWNLVPALLPAASFVLFRRILTLGEYTGISILILASVWICLLDRNRQTRWWPFWLMIPASLLQVSAFLVADVVYEETSFLLGFLLAVVGIVVTGLVPLISSRVRQPLWENRRRLLGFAHVFVTIEVINLLALFCSQGAIDMGVPSLVAAVEATIPGHVFVLSLLLMACGSRRADPRVTHRLIPKLCCVGAMAIGAWLMR